MLFTSVHFVLLRHIINLYIVITANNQMFTSSYNKTNKMREFLKFILGIELYMFQTVSLSIIRSLVLYTQ
jgi:hypothetical protein